MTDYATTGDGLIAGLHFVGEMARTGQRASALTRNFEPVPQLLRNVRYGSGIDPLSLVSVKAVIEAAEAELSGCGRLLIRKSGTEPLIRIMAECEDEALLTRVVEGIAAEVETTAA
jgi:phosphoglucosamine mutase